MATIIFTPAKATVSPAKPPSTASNRLSVSACRISRVRDAPSASRTEVCDAPRRAPSQQQVGYVGARNE